MGTLNNKINEQTKKETDSQMRGQIANCQMEGGRGPGEKMKGLGSTNWLLKNSHRVRSRVEGT